MNTVVKSSDGRWPGWHRRLYWRMHKAVGTKEVIPLDLGTISLNSRRVGVLNIDAVLTRRDKLVTSERLELYIGPPSNLDAESIRIHRLRCAGLEGQLQLEQVLRQLLTLTGDRPLFDYCLSFNIVVLNRHLRQLLDRQLHSPSIGISPLYYRKANRHLSDTHIDLHFNTLARALDVPVSDHYTTLGDTQAVALTFTRLLKGPAPKVIH